MYNGKAKVISNICLAKETFRLDIKLDEKLFIKPGQFAMINVGNKNGIILKRPISVHTYNDKTLSFIYAIKGQGTKYLSEFKADDTIELLLPLGNGFPCVKNAKKVVLIGGGMGSFPLFSLFTQNYKADFYSYLGFRNADYVVLENEFNLFSKQVKITTDDGSYGIKDCITNVLENDILEINPDIILACGPVPMFAALKKIVGNIPCFISMEERMACGFGACLVCTCKTKTGNKRTCTDGPVFDINEVVL